MMVTVGREGTKDVPAAFQQKVDDWNAAHPSHPPVLVRWEGRAHKRRATRWVCGIPVRTWAYEGRWQVGVMLRDPLPNIRKYGQYLDGSGGWWFIKLFSWEMQNTKQYLDLDDRIFHILGEGDMTHPRLYETKIEEPEAAQEAAGIRARRDMANRTDRYYRNYHNPTVSMNPTVKSSGKWRWRIR
jgi:hypothetical protein